MASSTSELPRGFVVVTNNIPVAEAYEAEFEDRFKNRVHLVDTAPGFIRNEVHRPKPMSFSHTSGRWEPDSRKVYYQIKTWWKSFADFEAWTRSKEFAIAHSRKTPKQVEQSRRHVHV